MKALICGFGRAGKRHAAILQMRGFSVFLYDPAWCQPFGRRPKGYDVCVIASPPDQHLDQLRLCATYGIPTLVEKPLCSFGQDAKPLAHYQKVSVAYNYRYHPSIQNLRRVWRGDGAWHFHSYQQRGQVPAWGLTLDHLPHTLDIMLYLTGSLPSFKKVEERTYRSTVMELFASGKLAGKNFTLIDGVSREPVKKLAYIDAPGITVDIPLDTGMFDRMWDDFLAEKYTGLDDAIQVQAALDDAKSRLKRRSVAA